MQGAPFFQHSFSMTFPYRDDTYFKADKRYTIYECTPDFCVSFSELLSAVVKITWHNHHFPWLSKTFVILHDFPVLEKVFLNSMTRGHPDMLSNYLWKITGVENPSLCTSIHYHLCECIPSSKWDRAVNTILQSKAAMWANQTSPNNIPVTA